MQLPAAAIFDHVHGAQGKMGGALTLVPLQLQWTSLTGQKNWPYYRGRGPLLESSGNFSGPKSNFQTEKQKIRARVLVNKLLHFVSLTDSFIMLHAKFLKLLSCM